ncbi:MAG: glycosyltransferase family 29 protein [Planctomycetota bacterium]
MPNSLHDFPAATFTSTEDLLQSMPQPIAVVGNAPIRRDYGDLIDEHATVVRFNNFCLGGQERKLGSKVTHWCVNGSVDRLTIHPPWFQRLVNKFYRSRPVGVQPNPDIIERTICFTPRPFDWVTIDNARRFLHVQLHCVADARLLAPLQSVIPYPTLGFATLYLLLRYQSAASVFGFAGLVGGHHENRDHRHSPRHAATALRELELIRATSGVQFYE